MIYEHCHYSYRQIREAIAAAGETRRREIIDLGLRHRGKHDELLRAFRAGQTFRFDILMDIGGFRDMHRHRRCVQIGQGFTTHHGYDLPEELQAAGTRKSYDSPCNRRHKRSRNLLHSGASEAEEDSQYAIPLGFRKRTLFKMDFAEVVYISELRTGPAGHFSYRNVAYAMYEAVAKRYPALAKYFRVHGCERTGGSAEEISVVGGDTGVISCLRPVGFRNLLFSVPLCLCREEVRQESYVYITFRSPFTILPTV